MVAARKPGHPTRIPYKVTVALFPGEWDEIRMEAQARGITGGELVSAILSKWVHDEEAPTPEDQGDGDPQDA